MYKIFDYGSDMCTFRIASLAFVFVLNTSTNMPKSTMAKKLAVVSKFIYFFQSGKVCQ